MRQMILARVFTHFLLLVILQSFSLGQANFPRLFNEYEEQKKEKATAYLLSSIVPGGGMYHVGKDEWGVAFTVSSSLLAYGVLTSKKGDEASKYLILLLALRVAEYVTVSKWVDDYNRELRRNLGLTLRSSQGSMMLPKHTNSVTVTLSFDLRSVLGGVW